MTREPVILCWSGGKDSTMALERLLNSEKYKVEGLFTTVNEHYKRISMHGVQEILLDQQAHALGLPLYKAYLSQEPTNEEYEQKMKAMCESFIQKGIRTVAFGDLYLQDLRKYRENNMNNVGMKAIFPVWFNSPSIKEESLKFVDSFISKGYKAYTCCVSDEFLKEGHVGVSIDDNFINSLPPNVDPCGENGEFHSFVFDGPIFNKPVQCFCADKVYRPLTVKPHGESKTKGFWFCDIRQTSPTD